MEKITEPRKFSPSKILGYTCTHEAPIYRLYFLFITFLDGGKIHAPECLNKNYVAIGKEMRGYLACQDKCLACVLLESFIASLL